MTVPARPSRSQNRLRQGAKYLWRRAFAFSLLTLVAGGSWRVGTAVWNFASNAAASTRAALAPRPNVDVLVVGGTPSGIAAALGAARSGARVTLVEERAKLGGDITYAYLNMFDVPLRSAHSSHSPSDYGTFGRFYRELGVGFDIERARKMFELALAQQGGIRVLKNTRVEGLQLEGGRLVGATLQNASGQETLRFHSLVDATNDAEIAARAGAGYSVGREHSNPDRAMQAAGLLFSVSNVDWNAVRIYVRHKKALKLRRVERWKHGAANSIDVRIDGRKALLRLGGVSGNYAWERGDIIKDYKPRGSNVLILSLNLGRQADGSVVLNTLNVVGVNGLNEPSRKRGIAEARREIPHLIKYLRARMPGFARAKLHHVAPELYVRETRHINGFETLTVSDVKNGTPFPDRVALASYPLDLHPYHIDDENPFGARRYVYALPLRALVPRKIDGVFVASRSLSATYSAAGSARVIPITMAAGEATGIAAALCAREDLTPHGLVRSKPHLNELQKRLRAAGLDIGDSLVKSKIKSLAKAPTRKESN